MNWLAHIFLSEQNIHFKIGNYLADPLKSKVWENAHKDISRGIETHKKIDIFTDSHEIFKRSKTCIRSKGLLRPVVIDIVYDYLLTKNWNTFCNEEFEEFTENFYLEASNVLEYLPSQAQIPLNRIINNRVLNKYQSIGDIEIALNRLDGRLSQRLIARETSSSYFKAVEKNIELLEKDFLEFFPLLSDKIKKDLDKNKLKHWK